MSDSLRQSTTDKAASSLKPDSEKSYVEQASDSVKSTADSAAGTLQPSGEKSTFQSASDTATGSGQEGKGYVEQAQEYVGAGVDKVKEATGMDQSSGSTGSSY